MGYSIRSERFAYVTLGEMAGKRVQALEEGAHVPALGDGKQVKGLKDVEQVRVLEEVKLLFPHASVPSATWCQVASRLRLTPLWCLQLCPTWLWLTHYWADVHGPILGGSAGPNTSLRCTWSPTCPTLAPEGWAISSRRGFSLLNT